MRVIIAPDSFKENMDASVASAAAAAGIHRVDPDIECVMIPVSDGGEGLVDVLSRPLGASQVDLSVTGPMGEPVTASYGWSQDSRVAVVEVAEACGVHLVPRDERDVMHATSRGVGEILEAARLRGARTIIVGLGGSVTNDGGTGLVQALGGRLLDEGGATVPDGPANVMDASALDLTGVADWSGVDVILARDVTNPLLGPTGASEVFAPQKGASREQVTRLDAILAHWADLLEHASNTPVRDLPGAGAAGGMGAALIAVVGAESRSGIDVVLDYTGFHDAVVSADLVLTGEGRMDSQTASGKAPWGVCLAATAAGVRTIALCGYRGRGAEKLVGPDGFDRVIEICDPAVPLERALKEGPQNMAATTERLFRSLVEPIA